MNDWKVFVQPSRQGTYHKKAGNIKCQDKYTVKQNDEIIVAALSDGLGSLEHSDIAASIVTKAISSLLFNYNYYGLNEIQLKNEILSECINAIKKCSSLKNINFETMDCTLLFVILLKKTSQLIYGQLGDGAIIGVKSSQGVLLSDFEMDAKASTNLTKTILSNDAIDFFNIRVDSANDFVGFLLTTDGLENEIYSRACKIKKKTEWYFNLISNNNYSLCVKEINKRWDSLTSEERFGFVDDMSLIAIVQPNINVLLPDEPTWLCVCMHRNNMDSSRCETCGTDFLKIYKDIDFRSDGGKSQFFSNLNKSPQQEVNIVLKQSLNCIKNTGKVFEGMQYRDESLCAKSSHKSVRLNKREKGKWILNSDIFNILTHTKYNLILKKLTSKIKSLLNKTNL